jgi:hypothetical protein
MARKLNSYEKLTIAKIRGVSDILRSLSDERLADLYHEYSEMFYSAGWLLEDDITINDFVSWATTPPYIWKKNP